VVPGLVARPDPAVLQRLAQQGVFLRQSRHPVDRVDGELEAVDPVEHGHVERRCGGAFLLVPADVQPLLVCPPVCQPVDQ
jgi:hypothetical protein